MPGTRKLGLSTAQRKAMLRNLVTSFLENRKIATTVSRAKETQSMTEKMITPGKKNTLHSRGRWRRILRAIRQTFLH